MSFQTRETYRWPALLAILAALACSQPATAQPVDRSCSGVVSFGDESPAIRLMQVATKAQRVAFHQGRTDRTPQCPAAQERCQLKSFVVPGDLLLVGHAADGFLCAHYIAPNVRRVNGQFRETTGFLPLAELSEIRRPSPSASDWLGTWSRSAEAEIRIEPAAGGKLRIAGEATFGALDPGRVRRGAVNMGELEGSVAPRGNMIALGEGYDGSKPFGDDRSECRARLRLFAPYLVVEDNGGCGGMNVSFAGVYVRLKDSTAR